MFSRTLPNPKGGLFSAIFAIFCAASAHAACPAAYPNNIPNTDICYLITAPGEYVPTPGAGAAPCPIGDYCPGGDKIYNNITIPERYTPVEYLENNGTAYIDTGHIPTHATTVNMDVMVTGGVNPSPWIAFFGTQVAYGTRYAAFMNMDTGQPAFDYFYGVLGDYDGGGNLIDKRFNLKTQILDNKLDVLYNDVIAYSAPITPAPNFQYGIYLFAMANDNLQRSAYGRFYFYKAYESDELIQDMIPVYDTVSEQYGMYDMVGHKFFGSANDDKFTGGPDLATSGGNFSCAAETHNEFTVSPPKSETVTDCGRILHIGPNKIYLRRRKITPHALAAKSGETIFYAETTTEQCGHLRTRLDGVVYSICNIGAD